MNRKIKVYDIKTKCFRELNPKNYNDDVEVGILFFATEVICILTKYYHVCGFEMIDKANSESIPIDIHENEVAVFEGDYNCMPAKLKKELARYNIHMEPSMKWSEFFIRWQFLGDWNAIEKSDAFIKLCGNILYDEERRNRFIHQERSIVFPKTYAGLCSLAQLLHNTFEVDLYVSGAIEEYNYVVDGLIHNYHINMTREDILRYAFQLCRVANSQMEG